MCLAFWLLLGDAKSNWVVLASQNEAVRIIREHGVPPAHIKSLDPSLRWDDSGGGAGLWWDDSEIEEARKHVKVCGHTWILKVVIASGRENF